MQHWLAAGQYEVTNRLPVKNVDRFERALALDILPILAWQLIERKAAKSTAGVARIVERELTKAWAAFLQNEPQHAVTIGLRQRGLACRILARRTRGRLGAGAFTRLGFNDAHRFCPSGTS